MERAYIKNIKWLCSTIDWVLQKIVSNKAMVIFSTSKKNTEKIWKKIVCKKMTIEKNVCGDTYFF